MQHIGWHSKVGIAVDIPSIFHKINYKGKEDKMSSREEDNHKRHKKTTAKNHSKKTKLFLKVCVNGRSSETIITSEAYCLEKALR